MNNFVLQSGSSWGKLGFVFFSDSTSYREVLEANPFWDITKMPVPGSILKEPDNSGLPSSGLTQSSITVSVDTGQYSADDTYYPYSNAQEYYQALSKYGSYALSHVEEINGVVQTSKQLS